MQIKIDKTIQTNRKTIDLQLTEDTHLIVRAPYYVNEQFINKVVLKHLEWIEKKKNHILNRALKFGKKKFVNGKGFLYLGESNKLKIVHNQKESLILKDKYFLLSKKYLPETKKYSSNGIKKCTEKDFGKSRMVREKKTVCL